MIRVTFVDQDGNENVFEGKEGESLLDLAERNNLDVPGPCGGVLACGRCHVLIA